MTVLLISLFFACSGDVNTNEAEVKSFNKLDLATLANAVDKAQLVPSPVEMQEKLAKSGLNAELGSLVTTPKDFMVVVGDDNDQTAIRTGIVMADLVLTVKSAGKETILLRLGKLKEGLDKLGAGADIHSTIEDFEQRVQSAEINRRELLSEFDDMASVMVSELEYEAGDWVVPLIQAGTWLEGANLVSKAMIKEGKYDAADDFFRQKQIVEYFISYINREGKERTSEGVATTLVETLKELKQIAAKPKLSEADVKKIEKLTSSVFALL